MTATTTTANISIPSTCQPYHIEEEEEEVDVDHLENGEHANTNDDEVYTKTSIMIHQVVGQQAEDDKGVDVRIIPPPPDNDDSDVDLEKGQQKGGEEEQKEMDCVFRNQKQMVFCPLTNRPLEDPVVHPKNGVSYERSAILQIEGDEGKENEESKGPRYYPNRALKEYLDPTTNPKIELQSNNPPTKKGIFYCSITTDLLRDPVIDPEGNTYERSAILEWIQDHGESPITRKPLKAADLYDNTTLLTILLHEIQQADDTLNPEEIQDWKKEVSSLPSNSSRTSATYSGSSTTSSSDLADPPLSTLRLALQPSTVSDDSNNDPPPLSAYLREEIIQPSSSSHPQAAGTATMSQEDQIAMQLHEQHARANATARLLDENRRIRHKRYMCRFTLVIILVLTIVLGYYWDTFIIVCGLVATGAWFGAVGIGCCTPGGPRNTSLSGTLNSGIA